MHACPRNSDKVFTVLIRTKNCEMPKNYYYKHTPNTEHSVKRVCCAKQLCENWVLWLFTNETQLLTRIWWSGDIRTIPTRVISPHSGVAKLLRFPRFLHFLCRNARGNNFPMCRVCNVCDTSRSSINRKWKAKVSLSLPLSLPPCSYHLLPPLCGSAVAC